MTNPYGQPGQPGQNPQQPGGYQQGGYQQSGGYPQSGGFAQPAYPSAPNYSQNQGAPVTRPGSATGASVLGFVQAGITLITTIILLFGLASASGAATDGGELALAWIVVIAQAVGAGLLIYGGVQLMSGSGRTIFLAAAGLEIAICLYYLIRIVSLDTDSQLAGASELKSSAAMFPILFAVMPVIGLSLALTGGVSRWVQAKRGA